MEVARGENGFCLRLDSDADPCRHPCRPLYDFLSAAGVNIGYLRHRHRDRGIAGGDLMAPAFRDYFSHLRVDYQTSLDRSVLQRRALRARVRSSKKVRER